MPHPEAEEWDYCSVCGIGTKRREHGTNDDGTPWESELSYTHCPWCGARLYDYKRYNQSQENTTEYTIDSQSETVSLKNGENQF